VEQVKNFVAASQMQPPLERLHWTYYDSEPLAAGATRQVFFNSIAGKSLLRTNMELPSALPAPKYFGIRNISVGLQVTDATATVGTSLTNNLATALVSILEDSFFEITISNKNFWEGPVWLLPQGGGVYTQGLLATDVAASLEVPMTVTNGPPGARFMGKLFKPLMITPVENFTCTISWGHTLDVTPLVNPLLYIFLEGVLARGAN